MEDHAIDVRNGEELDTEVLAEYLKDKIPGVGDDIIVRQFPGGFSNLTYLLKSGDVEMVLRRPPKGANIKTAHDMGREYRILSCLRPVFPYCPEPLVYCRDDSVLGAPFYIMRRIPGIILRKDLPEGLSFTPEEAQVLCERLLDLHMRLHAIDVKAAGLDFLGKPEGYVKRQVEGWSKRYRNAGTPDAPDFESVMQWLNEKQPPDTDAPAIVHNDFKFDNVVLDIDDPMSIIGVLDWEMATYGDPLMDLGNSLAYWVQKDDPQEMQLIKLMPTDMDGALTREDLIRRYGEKSGRNMSNFDFYYCFGLFRLAVIAQQIYGRYYRGLTKDKRFAMLIHGVRVLEQASIQVIENAKI